MTKQATAAKALKPETKQAPKAKKEKAKNPVEEVEAEIVTEAAPTQDVDIVRKKGDLLSLEMIESSIKRDIQIGARLDKASAMVSIKIGLALDSAKRMLKHGAYSQWVGYKFGNEFGTRKAQYFLKLANAFVRDAKDRIALPSPQETGSWLAVRDEGSDLAEAVSDFVGDLTVAELLEKHRIKVSRKAGGFNPSATMLNRYLQDCPEMAAIDPQDWTREQIKHYQAWCDANDDGDSAEAQAMAAEGAWYAIRSSLEEHGMSRASWKLLSHKTLQDTADVLKDVLDDIKKAIKAIADSK